MRTHRIQAGIRRDHFGGGHGGHGPQILKTAPIFLAGGDYGPHLLKMALNILGEGHLVTFFVHFLMFFFFNFGVFYIFAILVLLS